MNPPIKSTSLQAYRLILYRRALHPELFRIKGRRTIAHNGYDFEAWVMPGSHLLRFQYGATCATELITEEDDGVPERGLLTALPCAGERDHDQEFGDGINYVTTLQTEQLPENLYTATYAELIDFGRESNALVFEWNGEDGGRCGSVLDVQRYRREIHAQSYHMLSIGGVVLRSQTIFEIRGDR